MLCKILFMHFNVNDNENIYAKLLIIDSVMLFTVILCYCQDKSKDSKISKIKGGKHQTNCSCDTCLQKSRLKT